ncbi:MAG: hypothetical protein ACT4OG_05690 [Alphaproteobacteria bacterium]
MVRLALVRLLLCVVLINIALTALFVMSVTGHGDWLARLLPGEMGPGAGLWGNYVFLSLAVLVNAILILGTGFTVLVPAIFDDEPRAALSEINAARWIFRIGALLFVLVFPVVFFTIAHAEPEGAIFVYGGVPVTNGDIEFDDIALFTADQVVSAITFGTPEVFGRAVGDLMLNRDQAWTPAAVLVFRIVVALTFLTALVAAGREAALTARFAAEQPVEQRTDKRQTE